MPLRTREAPQLYQPLEQMRNVDAIMTNFADHAQRIFESDPTRDILVPLNGSILPLYYVVQQYANVDPEKLPEFINRLVFVADSKNEKGEVVDFRTSRNILTSNLFYLDDIVDEANSAAAFLSKVSGHIDVIAPIQKEHTEKRRRALNISRLGTQTMKIAPNGWIAGGLGMNEGVKMDSPEAQALLSTLQRFSRSVFVVNNSTPIDNTSRTSFFSEQLLPAFAADEPLVKLCYHMEYAKITGDTQGLLGLSQQIIPIIMDKLGVTT